MYMVKKMINGVKDLSITIDSVCDISVSLYIIKLVYSSKLLHSSSINVIV